MEKPVSSNGRDTRDLVYHKMIEEVQDYAILLLDRDGNVLNWNKGAQKIKGYSEDEVVGKNFRIFYGEEDRKNGLPETLISLATMQGRAMHEGWRLRKDGQRFWGSIVITALHNEDNEVIGFTKVTRDLTERKLAEDQLKQKAQELEFRNSELEQFAYVASHDLQEPLRKIQVFSDLLQKNIGNEELMMKFLDKINSSARRMSALIKDVLRYSKLSQKDEMVTSVDLNKILNHVLEDLELLLEQRQVRVVSQKLPLVIGIPVQLHQLFLNLISNSIKFSEVNPLIEIDAAKPSVEELREYRVGQVDRKYTKLIFRDHGIGFDPQYADDAFKLFKQLHPTEAGTGIGLAICKKIVENHGGRIHVFSKVKEGTTFYIFLPVD